MKKVISLVLSLLLAALSFTGCTGTVVNDNAQPTDIPQVTMVPGATAAQTQTPVETTSPVSISDSETYATPAESYAAYTEVKAAAMQKVSDKLNQYPDLSLTVGMSFLAVAMVELQVMGLVVMNEDPASAASVLEMLGASNVNVQSNGNGYVLTYSNSEGVSVTQNAAYDRDTDSLSTVLADEDGNSIVVMEYVRVDGGYAALYYVVSEPNLIISCYMTDEIVAFGIDETDDPIDSIQALYQNTSVTSDMIVNDDLYLIVTGDQMTVHENGVETVY